MKDILAKSYWVLLACLTALMFTTMEPPLSLLAICLLLLLEVSAREKHFANALESVTTYIDEVRGAAREMVAESDKTVSALKAEIARRDGGGNIASY